MPNHLPASLNFLLSRLKCSLRAAGRGVLPGINEQPAVFATGTRQLSHGTLGLVATSLIGHIVGVPTLQAAGSPRTWANDTEHCMHCQEKFSVARRRHHCRMYVPRRPSITGCGVPLFIAYPFGVFQVWALPLRRLRTGGQYTSCAYQWQDDGGSSVFEVLQPSVKSCFSEVQIQRHWLHPRWVACSGHIWFWIKLSVTPVPYSVLLPSLAALLPESCTVFQSPRPLGHL